MAKKQKTPAQIAAESEAALRQKQDQLSKQIDQLFNQAINAIVPLAAAQTLPPGVFTLSKLPGLESRIDSIISILSQNIQYTIIGGINDSWGLSNYKNFTIADIRLQGSDLPTDYKAVFYDTNADALASFLKQKEDGLNLSERVYKSTAQFKEELEAGLGLGISKGESAAEMGRDLRQYLKDPDKLFRRVRDDEGNLQLSKNAAAFHPGQGVYRSARKNIERLTVTTTNNAYRQADTTKYKQMPFVLGYEWRRSAQHLPCDICDSLAGEYPVDFIFTGGHPFCICYLVPILMTTKQFSEYQKLVLSGDDTPENMNKIASRITNIPDKAQAWLADNADRILNLKNTPYFWANNPNYMPDVSPTE